MPAHFQPAANKTHTNTTIATTPGTSAHEEDFSSPRSLQSRENTLRNAAKKWFGSVEIIDPKARAAEINRQEVILQCLLRLHRLSCNFVTETSRIPLQEQDVFTGIILLNRITITLGSPHAAVLCYCEARALREKNVRFNQIDPLQLRHLLTFHQDIPHEELNPLDIQRLRTACENSESTSIISWFETIAKRKASLPKDAPQFLRHLAAEIWNSGRENFLSTYARELAVLDTTLFHGLGWENTRLYLALLKRLLGSTCRSADAYLTEAEIAIAIEQSKQLGLGGETVHFRMLSTVYDGAAFRRLETAVLSAAGENGSRLPKSTDTHSPIARKNAVTPPPVYGTPAFFAQISARHTG